EPLDPDDDPRARLVGSADHPPQDGHTPAHEHGVGPRQLVGRGGAEREGQPEPAGERGRRPPHRASSGKRRIRSPRRPSATASPGRGPARAGSDVVTVSRSPAATSTTYSLFSPRNSASTTLPGIPARWPARPSHTASGRTSARTRAPGVTGHV